MKWQWLGRVPYPEALAAQEARRERILAGEDAESVLLLEHDPVITLGRSTGPGDLLVSPAELAARGIELAQVGRGGSATAHAPGQLVIYPVVRLRRGVLWHVETMAGAIVAELATLGVDARWRRDPAGVWVGEEKIAACGVHVRRRVAIHGFALNVTRACLAPFSLIVPCGLATAVTALEAKSAIAPPTLPLLASALGSRLVSLFNG